jgi:hypothetical protein
MGTRAMSWIPYARTMPAHPETAPRLIAAAALEPTTRALLVRVGADLTALGGSWNAPMDPRSGEFAYVPILEECTVKDELRTSYAEAARAVAVPPATRRAGPVRRARR